MTDVIGAAAFELRAIRDKLNKDVADAERDLDRSLGRMERDGVARGNRLGSGISSAFRGAAAAITGLVTVIGLAVTAMVGLGMAGQKMASDISASAARISVSTDALQEWRHVAIQAGEDAAAADQALGQFAKRFADAASGLSKEHLKAFESLGFTRDQLRSFDSVEDALDAVVRRVGDLSDEADRAAVSEKLGLGALSGALRRSADDVERLREEAHSLGLVMDREMIQRAATAQAEFETLSRIIDINLKSAFINLAPVINAVAQALADATTGLGQFANRFRDVQSLGAQALREEDARLAEAQMRYVDRNGGPPDRESMNPITRRAWDGLNERRANIATRLAGMASPPPATPPRGGGSLAITPSGGAQSSGAGDAEREAREALARDRRFEDMVMRAEADLARAMEGRAETANERAAAAIAGLERDQAAERVEWDRMVADGQLTEARKAELVAAQQRVAFVERDNIERERVAALSEQEAQAMEEISRLTADMLSVSAFRAETLAERRDLEVQLLAISQEQRRADLEALLTSKDITDARKAELRAILARLEEQERGAVASANRGPIADWVAAGADLNTHLQMVAADGLQSLNDGIVDAIMNTEDLGETFRKVARQIIADLAAIAVRRSITEPLANMLFGGGSGGSSGGGSGGFLSSVMGLFGFGGGRATGGPTRGGMIYDVGEQGPEKLLMPADGYVIPNSALSGQGAGSGRQTIHVIVDSRDEKFRAFIQETTGPMVAQGSQAAFQGARQQVPADMGRSMPYRLGRR